MVKPIVVALMLLATLPAARPRPVTSWGKAGVSFDQYRADAIACGREGYYRDVSDTEAARVFQVASRRLEANESDLATATTSDADIDRKIATAAQSEQIVRATRPAQRFAEVGAVLQRTVDDCLAGRGYVRYALTRDQERTLRRFKAGSPERHDFLYRLAADPAVLERQATAPRS